MSINLPLRSAPTLNFSWSERNGNTERFLPTSSKLLAMCPSVCRSAPPRCSCLFLFVKEHPFTEFILIGTDRTGNTERFMPSGQWAIGNVSITFLKTPIYIPLFSSLHRHNPPQALIINFTFGDNKWPMTFLTPFTPSKGPLAVVLAYNSSRTALMSALLLVLALSHGVERSREQRNNKCPGKILQCSTALGFGIVTRTIWWILSSFTTQ